MAAEEEEAAEMGSEGGRRSRHFWSFEFPLSTLNTQNLIHPGRREIGRAHV